MSAIALTGQELHNLAMNIVGTALRDELHWEFLLVNSQLKKDPQFVCVDKKNQKHFIIVRAVPYGEDPDAYDPALMQIVKKHAETHNAKAYFAGVGLTNIENEEFPIYKNKPYQVNFKGLLEIF
ncbi:Na(+)-translocating NADH-quinone reductase subunit F [Capnocytophaga stomatis]|uniref:Na(+)-translocating NADH-quinone reductase subunit F n=1 Tax=Capnocytophaga stomatis TaxID=1848904 RepID=A0A250FY93_9FLAO|nr:Na(+)-translocating NADH-quinone reductase subunit F [Capnocytophaga stomatis]ATA88956.1 Na(+)-translocating NADH-quinone reductase subunit F [Capnocytophaga stomatis]